MATRRTGLKGNGDISCTLSASQARQGMMPKVVDCAVLHPGQESQSLRPGMPSRDFQYHPFVDAWLCRRASDDALLLSFLSLVVLYLIAVAVASGGVMRDERGRLVSRADDASGGSPW